MGSFTKLILFPLFLLILNFLNSCSDKNSNSNYHPDGKDYTVFDFAVLAKLHTKLGSPKPGEWLYHYKETGQSFKDYCASDPVKPNDSVNKIYIQPIGSFTGIEQKLLKSTAQYVRVFFMLEVKLLEPISDKVVPAKWRKQQYYDEQLNTHYILDSVLLKRIPNDAICLISITNKDLYPGPGWNFVFGQASLRDRVGVSSYIRYFENKLDSNNYNICFRRIIETTGHELCHMFSIKHCRIYKCQINGANNLEEADSKPLWLCPECLAKLHWCIKFSLPDRDERLIEFFEALKFATEKRFYEDSRRLMSGN